jgi:hypothetical protein
MLNQLSSQSAVVSPARRMRLAAGRWPARVALSYQRIGPVLPAEPVRRLTFRAWYELATAAAERRRATGVAFNDAEDVFDGLVLLAADWFLRSGEAATGRPEPLPDEWLRQPDTAAVERHLVAVPVPAARADWLADTVLSVARPASVRLLDGFDADQFLTIAERLESHVTYLTADMAGSLVTAAWPDFDMTQVRLVVLAQDAAPLAGALARVFPSARMVTAPTAEPWLAQEGTACG